MNSRFMNRPGLGWAAALAAASALCGAALDAQAQQQTTTSGSAASSNEGALAEIVVTAERREENVQNVPISVAAFTAETLQNRNLVDIHALGNLTPGVNLDAGAPFSGDRSVLSASIRGIGQDDFAFNLNPGVGVYVDGVFFARTIGANQNLLDVDRVEILKGPQGTLFGANTIGGAISIAGNASAGATTCIARNPDGSSSDSSTTGRRSPNSTHQTSPRRMCPPGREMAGRCCAGRGWA